MPEPLKLSKVFGIEIDDVGVPGTYGGGYTDGYNRCLQDLNKLSPDEDLLTKIIAKARCDWRYAMKDKKLSDDGFINEEWWIAQEIINQMPLWIKKGNK